MGNLRFHSKSLQLAVDLIATTCEKIEFDATGYFMPVRKIKPGVLNTTSSIYSEKLGRNVEAESFLEKQYLFYIDKLPEVKWFDAQPLTIHYQDAAGRTRPYTPDVLVEFIQKVGSSSFTLYEIKYRQDLQRYWKDLKPKFKAAIQVCKEKGWRFKIMTEKEIVTPHLKNLEFLFHFSRSKSPVEGEVRQAIYGALKKLRHATVEEVMAFLYSDLDNKLSAYPVLWRMIEDGTLSVDLMEPLTVKSELWFEEE